MIVVVAGRFGQWIDRDKRLLGPGDAACIPAGMVHASFNVGDGEARLPAILGPCVGEDGIMTVDVADQAPWNRIQAASVTGGIA